MAGEKKKNYSLSENDLKEIQETLNQITTHPNIEHKKRVTDFLIQKKIEKEAIIAWILLNNPKEQQNNNLSEKTKTIITECERIEELINKNYQDFLPENMISLILSLVTDLQTIIIKMTETNDLLKNQYTKNDFYSKKFLLTINTKIRN
jgi:hypothetical protein